jgi:exosortase
MRTRRWILPGLVGLAALVWAYWPTLTRMAERWNDDPQYSHGYLVPLFSLYVLWLRRSLLRDAEWEPSWWGMGLLGAGVGLRVLGAFVYFGWLEEISILLMLLGLVLCVGGWQALRWAYPAVLFLGFMAPLPYSVQNALGAKLQALATQASTYALQTLGAPAVSEGNVIIINDTRIGIVEACSGLGMLVTFFALSTAVAMLLRSSDLWLRLTVVASAVPVAILANVARITVTGMLYSASKHQAARIFFHDAAGWIMMPLAVGMLLLEIRVLRRLVRDRSEAPARVDGVDWLPGPVPAAPAPS